MRSNQVSDQKVVAVSAAQVPGLADPDVRRDQWHPAYAGGVGDHVYRH